MAALEASTLGSFSFAGAVKSDLPSIEISAVEGLVGRFGSLNIREFDVSEASGLNRRKGTFPVYLSVTILALTTSPAWLKYWVMVSTEEL